MKSVAGALTALLLAAIVGTNVRAEDISWVAIHNQDEATLASAIVGRAYIRDGNRFLVGLTAEQADALTTAGLEVTPVLRDADPAQTFRVMSENRSLLAQPSLVTAAGVTDLGNGILLMQSSANAAAQLSGSSDYLITPLSDLSIRWLYLAPSIESSLAQITDYPTDSLVNLVSQDSIYDMDQHLMDFQTRYIWSDSNESARMWIKQKFESWGYTDVTLQPFPYAGGTHYNVVCVKPGYAEPDKVIVVGAHYDSINHSSDPMVFAPGADDNGSGSTTVMEMARVLKDVPCRKTIIFITFSAEEEGLIGSGYAAHQFVADSTNIEVMYNFDMVGYDPSDLRQISLSGASFNSYYSDFTGLSAGRVTDLTPMPVTAPGGSDFQSFMDQGFPVVNVIETDFNYGGWHTDSDITSRMNFPYFTKVVKMGLASLAVVANSAHPTSIAKLTDEGDGQSIEVFWSDCDNTYKYTLYWGLTPGAFTDSMSIPPGACSQVVSGLTEGVPYYFSVVGELPGGYPALYSVTDSLTPLVVPRAPLAVRASPVYHAIQLNWAAGPEADLEGYRIYRRVDGFNWQLYRDNILDTSFTDSDVVGQIRYDYRISAVDHDGNESAYSAEFGSWPATFDGGILIADEMTQGTGVPTQDQQVAFWDTTFGGTPFAITQIEGATDSLQAGIAGQYSSIFWFDDDLAIKNLSLSLPAIKWYLGFSTNMLISGQRTIQYWGGASIPTDDIRYTQFGLATYTDNTAQDFAGAHGQNGWPDVQIDTSNFFGLLPNIPSLTAAPGAQVIYTYDAASGDSSREGTPVGLLNQTPEGYRILLAFPVTFLTDSTATLLISHAKALFGESATVATAGDVDGSGVVDIADISYLVTALFKGGPPPVSMNGADVDGDCRITIADLTYLVVYVFRSGPAPLPGCVE